jgi:hypothetical protein
MKRNTEIFLLKSFYIINSVLGKPMKTFQKEQKCEHCDKFRTKIVTEHSERQTSFSYSIPASLKQMLINKKQTYLLPIRKLVRNI